MAIEAIAMIFLSGISEGIMDWIQFRLNAGHHLYSSMFWNPKYSWRNKWKNGDPRQGERFWQSSRLFVFVTDGWHLMKMSRNLLLFVGMFHIATYDLSLLAALILIVVCRLMYGLGFSIAYNWFHKI